MRPHRKLLPSSTKDKEVNIPTVRGWTGDSSWTLPFSKTTTSIQDMDGFVPEH